MLILMQEPSKPPASTTFQHLAVGPAACQMFEDADGDLYESPSSFALCPLCHRRGGRNIKVVETLQSSSSYERFSLFVFQERLNKLTRKCSNANERKSHIIRALPSLHEVHHMHTASMPFSV